MHFLSYTKFPMTDSHDLSILLKYIAGCNSFSQPTLVVSCRRENSGSCAKFQRQWLYLAYNRSRNFLYGIELIWTKYHQALVALVQHDIFPYDFAKRTFFQEKDSKLIQFIERMIGGIRPIECKLVTAVRIIGKKRVLTPLEITNNWI